MFVVPSNAPMGAYLFSTVDRVEGTYVTLRPFTIHPSSRFMMYWNVVMGITIMFCAMFIPWQWAFEFKTMLRGGTFWQRFWHVVQPMMDTYFLLDIMIQFRCAFFDKDGELEQRSRQIAWRYLQGWFVIDSLSTFSFLFEMLASAADLSMLRQLKILRLIRLLKLPGPVQYSLQPPRRSCRISLTKW